MKVLNADFVTSAARADDIPRDDLARIALVGRSNVGKSSLINALCRAKIALAAPLPGLAATVATEAPGDGVQPAISDDTITH